MADYSVERRIRELYSEAHQCDIEEVYPQSIGRGGKKVDIYRFGLVVTALCEGAWYRSRCRVSQEGYQHTSGTSSGSVCCSLLVAPDTMVEEDLTGQIGFDFEI